MQRNKCIVGCKMKRAVFILNLFIAFKKRKMVWVVVRADCDKCEQLYSTRNFERWWSFGKKKDALIKSRFLESVGIKNRVYLEAQHQSAKVGSL